jgi:4-amino-4-deoxy-L-arabinose transferase-like glycosyltransferase
MNLQRLAFPILIGLFVVLAFAYSVIVPLGEAPDEVSHWAYVQSLLAHSRLPAPEGAVLGEAHQPPLYYLIGALATFWIPRQDFQVIANPDFVLDDPQTPNLLLHTRREAFPYHDDALAWHLVRLLSVALGLVTVWATSRLASEVFPSDPWIAFGATALIAFLPEFLFISAVVNNDNLIVMLSTLSVLQMFRMMQRPSRRCDAAVLGMLLGLAPLAKLSGLVVWLIAAAIFFFLAHKTSQWKDVVFDFTLCFGIATAIVAPWVIYNWQQYGDPFGWPLVLAVTPVRQTPMSFGDWIGIIQGLFTSFWGRFGGALQLQMADAVYATLGAAGFLALLGWIGYAQDARKQKLAASVRAIFILFAAFWLLMLAAYVRWTLTVLGTDQARQLFPGLPLLAIFLAAGLARLFTSYKKVALAAWSGGLLALTLAALFYLHSIYAAPLYNASSLIPLGGALVPTDFGQTIRVMDYRIGQTRVAPDSSITLQVYWQALNDPPENYWLLLQLIGTEGTVANKDGVPSTGRLTTDWWKTGQVFVSRHTLVVPNDVAPGIYSLQIGLHPFGRWEWLPVRGRDMFALGNILVTATP